MLQYIALAIIVLGFILLIMGLTERENEEYHYYYSKKEREKKIEDLEDKKIIKKDVKGGGVILVGPIPIVFGSDARYAIIALILAIILMLISLTFLLKLY